MTNKQPATTSYYEIVKYNLRTRKDLKVLPDQVQGLSAVNSRIDALNALLKEGERGDVIYYRRKVRV